MFKKSACVLLSLAVSGSMMLSAQAATTDAASQNDALAANAKPVTHFTLRIQLSPAVCMLKPERQSWRQCRDGYATNVLGLRPEFVKADKADANKISMYAFKHHVTGMGKTACSKEKAQLSPLQTKLLSRIMPDNIMRTAVWQHYGSCMKMTSPEYFRMIVNFNEKVTLPTLLSSGTNVDIEKSNLIDELTAKNKGLAPTHIQTVCRKTEDSKKHLLTELQICFDDNGSFANCAKPTKGECPSEITILGL